LSSKLQILSGTGNRRPSIALSILTGRVAEQLSVLENFYAGDCALVAETPTFPSSSVVADSATVASHPAVADRAMVGGSTKVADCAIVGSSVVAVVGGSPVARGAAIAAQSATVPGLNGIADAAHAAPVRPSRPHLLARTVYLTEAHLRNVEAIIEAWQPAQARRVTRSAVLRIAIEHLRDVVNAEIPAGERTYSCLTS
jgi:hypothetical protein